MPKIKHNQLGLKLIAIFLVGLSFIQSISWAAPLSANEMAQALHRLPKLVEKIQIPESLGIIQERFVSSSPSSISLFHIEDAHGEPEAQKNIQSILEHLQKNHGIKVLFLEGAWSQLDASRLEFSKDKNANQEILDQLSEKGVVGGPERFFYEASGNKGFGIENLDLYKKNLNQFQAVMREKSESDIFLNSIKAGLLTKASQTFNVELASYFRQWSFQEEVESDYSAHLRMLSEFSKKHLKLDLSDAREQYDWPQLVRFFKLKELEKNQEPGIKNQEIEQFKKWAANHFKSQEIESLLDLASNQRDMRGVLEGFYERAASLGFKFQDYPMLSKQWAQLVLSQEIQAPALIAEIQKIEERLLEKLAQTPDEKKVIEKYREYLLLKKLLHLELTKEEWKEFSTKNQESGTKIKTEEIARQFYKTADLRDQAMFDRTLDWVKKEKIEKAVIVTGGFHSKGLSELFKQKNISYLRIQPRITQIKGRENYLKLMTANASHLRAMSLAEPNPLPGLEVVYRSEIRTERAIKPNEPDALHVRFKIFSELSPEEKARLSPIFNKWDAFHRGLAIEGEESDAIIGYVVQADGKEAPFGKQSFKRDESYRGKPGKRLEASGIYIAREWRRKGFYLGQRLRDQTYTYLKGKKYKSFLIDVEGTPEAQGFMRNEIVRLGESSFDFIDVGYDDDWRNLSAMIYSARLNLQRYSTSVRAREEIIKRAPPRSEARRTSSSQKKPLMRLDVQDKEAAEALTNFRDHLGLHKDFYVVNDGGVVREQRLIRRVSGTEWENDATAIDEKSGTKVRTKIVSYGPFIAWMLGERLITQVKQQVKFAKRKINSWKSGLKSNLLLTSRFDYDEEGILSFKSFVPEMLTEMKNHPEAFKGKAVVDLGAGNGVLAQAALMLGAKKVYLVDQDEDLLGKARSLLAASGWIEGKNFEIIKADLSKPSGKKILKRKGIYKKVQTIIANIGPWEIYEGANDQVVNSLGDWPRAKFFFNGGFGAAHSEEQDITQEKLRRWGWLTHKTPQPAWSVIVAEKKRSEYRQQEITSFNEQIRAVNEELLGRESPSAREKINRLRMDRAHLLMSAGAEKIQTLVIRFFPNLHHQLVTGRKEVINGQFTPSLRILKIENGSVIEIEEFFDPAAISEWIFDAQVPLPEGEYLYQVRMNFVNGQKKAYPVAEEEKKLVDYAHPEIVIHQGERFYRAKINSHLFEEGFSKLSQNLEPEKRQADYRNLNPHVMQTGEMSQSVADQIDGFAARLKAWGYAENPMESEAVSPDARLTRELFSRFARDGFVNPQENVTGDMLYMPLLFLSKYSRALRQGSIAANPEQVERVQRMALDGYRFIQLSLLSMRAWDQGDANQNLDRLQQLLNLLEQGQGGSEQAFAGTVDHLVGFAKSIHTGINAEYLYPKFYAEKIRPLNEAWRNRFIHSGVIGFAQHLHKTAIEEIFLSVLSMRTFFKFEMTADFFERNALELSDTQIELNMTDFLTLILYLEDLFKAAEKNWFLIATAFSSAINVMFDFDLLRQITTLPNYAAHMPGLSEAVLSVQRQFKLGKVNLRHHVDRDFPGEVSDEFNFTDIFETQTLVTILLNSARQPGRGKWGLDSLTRHGKDPERTIWLKELSTTYRDIEKTRRISGAAINRNDPESALLTSPNLAAVTRGALLAQLSRSEARTNIQVVRKEGSTSVQWQLRFENFPRDLKEILQELPIIDDATMRARSSSEYGKVLFFQMPDGRFRVFDLERARRITREQKASFVIGGWDYSFASEGGIQARSLITGDLSYSQDSELEDYLSSFMFTMLSFYLTQQARGTMRSEAFKALETPIDRNVRFSQDKIQIVFGPTLTGTLVRHRKSESATEPGKQHWQFAIFQGARMLDWEQTKSLAPEAMQQARIAFALFQKASEGKDEPILHLPSEMELRDGLDSINRSEIRARDGFGNLAERLDAGQRVITIEVVPPRKGEDDTGFDAQREHFNNLYTTMQIDGFSIPNFPEISERMADLFKALVGRKTAKISKKLISILAWIGNKIKRWSWSAWILDMAHEAEAFKAYEELSMPGNHVATIAAQFNSSEQIRGQIRLALKNKAQILFFVGGGHPLRKVWLIRKFMRFFDLAWETEEMLREAAIMREEEPDLFHGVTFAASWNPYEEPHKKDGSPDFEKGLRKLERKKAAGAKIIFTQPPILRGEFMQWFEEIAKRSELDELRFHIGVARIENANSLRFWYRLVGVSPEEFPEARQLITQFEDAEKYGIKEFFANNWNIAMLRDLNELPVPHGLHLMPAVSWKKTQKWMQSAGITVESRRNLDQALELRGFVRQLLRLKHPVRISYSRQITSPESPAKGLPYQNEVKPLLEPILRVLGEVQAKTETDPRARQFFNHLRLCLTRIPYGSTDSSKRTFSPHRDGMELRREASDAWREVTINVRAFSDPVEFERKLREQLHAWIEGKSEDVLPLSPEPVKGEDNPIYKLSLLIWRKFESFRAHVEELKKVSFDLDQEFIDANADDLMARILRTTPDGKPHAYVELSIEGIQRFEKMIHALHERFQKLNGDEREQVRNMHLQYVFADLSPQTLSFVREELGKKPDFLAKAEEMNISWDAISLNALQPGTVFEPYRGRVLVVHTTNLYDAVPTNYLAKLGSSIYEVLSQAILSRPEARRIAEKYHLDFEKIESAVGRIAKGEDPEIIFLESQTLLGEEVYAFWVDLILAIRLRDVYEPINVKSHSWATSEGRSLRAVLLNVIQNYPGNIRLPDSRFAVQSMVEMLEYLHPEGVLEATQMTVDIAATRRQPQEFRTYVGTAISPIFFDVVSEMARRRGFNMTASSFKGSTMLKTIRIDRRPVYLIGPKKQADYVAELDSKLPQAMRVSLEKGITRLLQGLPEAFRFVIGRGMGYGDSRTHWGAGLMRANSYAGGLTHEALDFVYGEVSSGLRQTIPVGLAVPPIAGKGKLLISFTDDMRHSAVIDQEASIMIGGKEFHSVAFYTHIEMNEELKIGDEVTDETTLGVTAKPSNSESKVAPHLHFGVGLVSDAVYKKWKQMQAQSLGVSAVQHTKGKKLFPQISEWMRDGEIIWLDALAVVSPDFRASHFIEGRAARPGVAEIFITGSKKDIQEAEIILGRRFPSVTLKTEVKESSGKLSIRLSPWPDVQRRSVSLSVFKKDDKWDWDAVLLLISERGRGFRAASNRSEMRGFNFGRIFGEKDPDQVKVLYPQQWGVFNIYHPLLETFSNILRKISGTIVEGRKTGFFKPDNVFRLLSQWHEIPCALGVLVGSQLIILLQNTSQYLKKNSFINVDQFLAFMEIEFREMHKQLGEPHLLRRHFLFAMPSLFSPDAHAEFQPITQTHGLHVSAMGVLREMEVYDSLFKDAVVWDIGGGDGVLSRAALSRDALFTLILEQFGEHRIADTLMRLHGYKSSSNIAKRKDGEHYAVIGKDVRRVDFKDLARNLPPDIILMNWGSETAEDGSGVSDQEILEKILAALKGLNLLSRVRLIINSGYREVRANETPKRISSNSFFHGVPALFKTYGFRTVPHIYGRTFRPEGGRATEMHGQLIAVAQRSEMRANDPDAAARKKMSRGIAWAFVLAAVNAFTVTLSSIIFHGHSEMPNLPAPINPVIYIPTLFAIATGWMFVFRLGQAILGYSSSQSNQPEIKKDPLSFKQVFVKTKNKILMWFFTAEELDVYAGLNGRQKSLVWINTVISQFLMTVLFTVSLCGKLSPDIFSIITVAGIGLNVVLTAVVLGTWLNKPEEKFHSNRHGIALFLCTVSLLVIFYNMGTGIVSSGIHKDFSSTLLSGISQPGVMTAVLFAIGAAIQSVLQKYNFKYLQDLNSEMLQEQQAKMHKHMPVASLKIGYTFGFPNAVVWFYAFWVLKSFDLLPESLTGIGSLIPADAATQFFPYFQWHPYMPILSFGFAAGWLGLYKIYQIVPLWLVTMIRSTASFWAIGYSWGLFGDKPVSWKITTSIALLIAAIFASVKSGDGSSAAKNTSVRSEMRKQDEALETELNLVRKEAQVFSQGEHGREGHVDSPKEMLRLLTADGIFTDMSKERQLVHKDGDWHATVNVFFRDSKGRIWLQQRSDLKDISPNKLQITSGGHVEAKHDEPTTVEREVFEELGIEIDLMRIRFVIRSKKDQYPPESGENRSWNREFTSIYVYDMNEAEETEILRNFNTGEIQALWVFSDFDKLAEQIKAHPRVFSQTLYKLFEDNFPEMKQALARSEERQFDEAWKNELWRLTNEVLITIRHGYMLFTMRHKSDPSEIDQKRDALKDFVGATFEENKARQLKEAFSEMFNRIERDALAHLEFTSGSLDQPDTETVRMLVDLIVSLQKEGDLTLPSHWREVTSKIPEVPKSVESQKIDFVNHLADLRNQAKIMGAVEVSRLAMLLVRWRAVRESIQANLWKARSHSLGEVEATKLFESLDEEAKGFQEFLSRFQTAGEEIIFIFQQILKKVKDLPVESLAQEEGPLKTAVQAKQSLLDETSAKVDSFLERLVTLETVTGISRSEDRPEYAWEIQPLSETLMTELPGKIKGKRIEAIREYRAANWKGEGKNPFVTRTGFAKFIEVSASGYSAGNPKGGVLPVEEKDDIPYPENFEKICKGLQIDPMWVISGVDYQKAKEGKSWPEKLQLAMDRLFVTQEKLIELLEARGIIFETTVKSADPKVILKAKRPTVSQWLTDVSLPSQDKWIAISDALQDPELFEGVVPRAPVAAPKPPKVPKPPKEPKPPKPEKPKISKPEAEAPKPSEPQPFVLADVPIHEIKIIGSEGALTPAAPIEEPLYTGREASEARGKLIGLQREHAGSTPEQLVDWALQKNDPLLLLESAAAALRDRRTVDSARVQQFADLAMQRLRDKKSRSEDRSAIWSSAQIAVSELVGNIFQVERLVGLSRIDFLNKFGQIFSEWGVDRQKHLYQEALQHAGLSSHLNEGIVIGAHLAKTEGFWEMVERVLPNQKLAVLSNEIVSIPVSLKNVKVFSDIALAKAWLKTKKVSAWMNPDDAMERIELRKQVSDWVILTNERLIRLYSAIGLENLAEKLMSFSQISRAA